MGISPPSDLVFDVMQAAEGVRARQVMDKLQSLAPAADGAFRAELATVAEARAAARADKPDRQAAAAAAALIPAGTAFSGTTLTGLRNAHALGARSNAQGLAGTPGAASLQKFEAMVLSQFLDAMMPASKAVYGAGNAGETWKSLLTQKVGEAVAKSGGIGIADRLSRVQSLFGKAGGAA